MGNSPELFRTYGFQLVGTVRPPEVVCAALRPLPLLGQYAGLGLVAAFGLALAAPLVYLVMLLETARVAALFCVSVPLVIIACGFAFLIWLLVRNSYVRVELEGEVLRAKQLLTGRVVTRHLLEIEDLATLISNQDLVSHVAEKWSGRVRGARVRFRDGRAPIAITLRDPAMANARELIEAILCGMMRYGALGYDVELIDGKPLVSRLYWKFHPAEWAALGGETPDRPAAGASDVRSAAISPPGTPLPTPPPTGRSPPPPPPRSS